MDLSNWKPAHYPAQGTLEGRVCRLVPFEQAHIDALYETLQINNDQASWDYLPYGPFPDRTAFQNWMNAELKQGEAFFYTIIDKHTSAAQGLCAYARIRQTAGSIEIAHIHFSPRLKQQTAATEAIYLLINNAILLGNRRVEWKCNTQNLASHKAALRFGFVFEGVFRQDQVVKNRNRDTAWFSILDSEWPQLKARFEAWLDPQNFREDGTQIKRLSEVSL